MTSEPRGRLLFGISQGGCPVYCPDGVRHGGGTSLVQALAWNVGTCCPDTSAVLLVIGHPGEREFAKQLKLQGAEYRCWAQGQTVS